MTLPQTTTPNAAPVTTPSSRTLLRGTFERTAMRLTIGIARRVRKDGVPRVFLCTPNGQVSLTLSTHQFGPQIGASFSQYGEGVTVRITRQWLETNGDELYARYLDAARTLEAFRT